MIRPLQGCDVIRNELPMPAQLLEGLLIVPEQLRHFLCILTLLGHPLDEGNLLGQAPLSLGDLDINLGRVLAFFPHAGHGVADHTPNCARGYGNSDETLYRTQEF